MKISAPTAPSPLMALQQALHSRFQAKLETQDTTQVKAAALVSPSPRLTSAKLDIKA